MTEQAGPPIECELLRTLAEISVTETRINATSADDKHVCLEGRLGLEENGEDDPMDDVEHFAFGFIFALGVLSFADARPRGVSGIDFEEEDMDRGRLSRRRKRVVGHPSVGQTIAPHQ